VLFSTQTSIALYIRRPCLFSASFVAMTSNVEVNRIDLQKSENLVMKKNKHIFYCNILKKLMF
jgi:hypothetical protein